MEKKLKILFIEDNKTDALLVCREIEKNNLAFEYLLVENKNDFLEGLKTFDPDIIISDYILPDFDGMSALLLRNSLAPFIPFILVTGSMNEDVAVECMKTGADDYVIKENLSRLVPAISNSFKKVKILKDKKEADENLVLSEKRLKIALEKNFSGVWDLNLIDHTAYRSLIHDNIFGYKTLLPEWTFEMFLNHVLPEDRLDVERSFTDAISKESDWDFECRIRRKDGEIRWISATGGHVQNSEGKSEHMTGLVQDITVRKNYELDIVQALEKAEEGDRLKNAFLHNISHEIRTPMNAIVGFSALLNEPDNDLQTQQSYTELIVQSSNHLLSIVTDIVNMSNIDAKIEKIVKKEISVNSTLKSLCNRFMPEADKKKLKLTYETLISDSDDFIIGDISKLTGIISNLISNALKFTDNGYIKVFCKRKENLLEFCVTDTGIGIPAEYHEKVFDRFYQVQHSVSRIYEGTGLGLAISKGYVDLLGGDIWLESEPGKGTKFYFTIPYEKPDLTKTASSEVKILGNPILKTRKTILITEDIDHNFKLLTYFLLGLNINILRAVNGKEAVEKCLSGIKIDLVLMDLRMPIMDGYAATRIIKESNPDIPIIAQTSYADDLQKSKETGFNGFISKPFSKQQLLTVLKEIFLEKEWSLMS